MNISNIDGNNYVEISPIKIKYYDTNEANYIMVRSILDNLIDSTTFYYVLVNIDITGSITNLDSGNIIMDGDDYSSWTGDNQYPFTWISSKLNITLV